TWCCQRRTASATKRVRIVPATIFARRRRPGSSGAGPGPGAASLMVPLGRRVAGDLESELPRAVLETVEALLAGAAQLEAAALLAQLLALHLQAVQPVARAHGADVLVHGRDPDRDEEG